ncbi:MAG: diacylglycerol kinase family protein [Saprospiraceae bacterium]
MEGKKKIRFIANPFSGTKDKGSIASSISRILNHDIFDYEIIYTTHRNHATELAKESVELGYWAAIAVGGDGTINEVAKGLVGSNTALGLVPYGSGNGFAYHIGIKRSVEKAIMAINGCQTEYIDTGLANEHFFINIAGLGLDATVAHKTKQNTRRGFIPYFIQTLKESWGFRYLDLKIKCGDKEWQNQYGMAVIANGSVYGYDFRVASEAKLDDGLFDILLVKKTCIIRYFLLVLRMLWGTFHKSSLVEFIKAPEIIITHQSSGFFHVDGEGHPSEKVIYFKILPKSILLIKAP